jgi:hypothetical protein
MTSSDHPDPLYESSWDYKGRSTVGVSVERMSRAYKQRVETNSLLLPISLSPTTKMPDRTAQSTNVPAFEPGTATNNTHNDKVYVNFSTDVDPRAVAAPEYPAGMSVFASPSAKERLIGSAGGKGAPGTVIDSMGHSLQTRNNKCPIKGPLLPQAKGNTRKYQWEEWTRQAKEEWTESVDAFNKTRHGSQLEMVIVAEPSEAWQEELGVSLVPMNEVYHAASEARSRARSLKPVSMNVEFSRSSNLESRPSVGSRVSLFRPAIEDADPASKWAFITPPTVPEDDASNHT